MYHGRKDPPISISGDCLKQDSMLTSKTQRIENLVVQHRFIAGAVRITVRQGSAQQTHSSTGRKNINF